MSVQQSCTTLLSVDGATFYWECVFFQNNTLKCFTSNRNFNSQTHDSNPQVRNNA